jgi:tetratricopeptide (TPR) repeat protein
LNKKQIILLAVALVFVIVLYLAPRSDEAEKFSPESEGHGLEAHLSGYVSRLDSVSLKEFEGLEEILKRSPDLNNRVDALDLIVNFWEVKRNPMAAAYYAEKIAELNPSAENFKKAAEKYFASSGFSDEHLKKHAIENAARCYEEALKLNGSDIDTKLNLAVCYVEGAGDPMQGIGLLRSILEVEPENIRAIMYLGYFSVKSGQYDKAAERFEQVLKIDPHHLDAYLYLGDVHESKGEKDKAIEYYQKYMSFIDDPLIKEDVERYIEKLKLSINK